MEEIYIEGEKEGIKKGRERYYGKGIVLGESEEHKRWKAEGHGQYCLAVTTQACLEDAGTQTDLVLTTIASIYNFHYYCWHSEEPCYAHCYIRSLNAH